MFSRLTRVFAGHPHRISAAGALGLAGLALAWYLGSPLFITTYADEALPAARAPAPTFGTAVPSARDPVPSTAAREQDPVVLVLVRGELGFIDNLHNGKGPVQVVQIGERRFVRFESVAITNAPDIHIYLSKDTGGKYVEGNTVYLGPLRATNGSFNYEVPASVDLAQYKSVVVWCRAFTTLMTWADLR